MKKIFLIYLILFLFVNQAFTQKGTVKSAAKILEKKPYENYNDYKTLEKWKKKWDKVYKKGKITEFQAEFTEQAKKILSAQMKVLNNFINSGNESETDKQRKFIKQNFDYVRSKLPGIKLNIEDLNDNFLDDLAMRKVKTVKAGQFAEDKNYQAWFDKWKELPTPLTQNFELTSFEEQANKVFQDLLNKIQNAIDNANERTTEKYQKTLRKYYDFAREKDPDFDNNVKIKNLNDFFIDNALKFAKINYAKKLMKQKAYADWMSKWEELKALTEQYQRDSFELQSVELFRDLWSRIQQASASSNFSVLENLSELSIDLLNRTYKLFPQYDQIKSQYSDLENFNLNYLSNIKRNSKINVADNLAKNGNFSAWLNKWIEISKEDILNNTELGLFEKQADFVFDKLIERIKNNTVKGNVSDVKTDLNFLTNLKNNDIFKVDPNYLVKNKDINDIFIKNIVYMSQAYKDFYAGNYYIAVRNLKENAGDDLTKKEFLRYFDEFYVKTMQKTVDIYMNAFQKQDYKSINDALLLMQKIYDLKPDNYNFKYIPQVYNENKYKTFKTWLDSRFRTSLDFYYTNADSLINKNLYVDAYKYVFYLAAPISLKEADQNTLKKYENIFETKGTDFYKQQIYNLIRQNSYLIAKNVLDNQLLFINPDFKQNRSDEYKKIVSDIRTLGTKYYENKRDYQLSEKNYPQAHSYCDSISFINKTYDLVRCHDEIEFLRLYNKIVNVYLSSNKYICALDSAKKLLDLKVSDDYKSDANELISTCEDYATITIDIAVFSDYGFPESETQIQQRIYDRLKNYSYPYSGFLKIKMTDLSGYENDILRGEARNFKYDHPKTDVILVINVNNFEYYANWNKTENRYVCKKYHKTETQYVWKEKKKKKTTEIDGKEYYVITIYLQNGTMTVYGKVINGTLYYLNTAKLLVPFYGYWEYQYETEKVKEPVQVSKYKYSKVSFKAKYGREYIEAEVNARLLYLKDNSVLTSNTKNLEYNKNYTKYVKPYGYELDELCICPENISYDVWIEGNYSCSRIDKTYFYTPDDPFEGKETFYKKHIASDLYKFLNTFANNSMAEIEKIHNSMKCR